MKFLLQYSSVAAPDLGMTLHLEYWTDPTLHADPVIPKQVTMSPTAPRTQAIWLYKNNTTLGVRRSGFSPDFVPNSLCYLSQVASPLWVWVFIKMKELRMTKGQQMGFMTCANIDTLILTSELMPRVERKCAMVDQWRRQWYHHSKYGRPQTTYHCSSFQHWWTYVSISTLTVLLHLQANCHEKAILPERNQKPTQVLSP